MEDLNRGLVAVHVDGGIYVGWRMFGYEYDRGNPGRRVQRLSRRRAGSDVTDSTNYEDAAGRAVVYGARGARRLTSASNRAPRPWAQQYLRIPLKCPRAATPWLPHMRDRERRAHLQRQRRAASATWTATASTRSSSSGTRRTPRTTRSRATPGNVYIDAYKLDGTRLWRIDLGRTSAPARTTRSSSSTTSTATATPRSREDGARHARRRPGVPEHGPARTTTTTPTTAATPATATC